ncbi:MAG: imelysin family protein [Sandaracinaceae bacterium]|nr:imelysin family protein [Sandaracinaceae bacterium]
MRRLGLFVLSTLLLSCGPSGPPPDFMGARRREVLASMGSQVVLPMLRRFATEAGELEAATSAYAADRSDTNRTAAQQAWIEAIDAWQEVEVVVVGPAGMSFVVPGGQDFRDQIYSWPVTNPCRIDQETVEGSYTSPDTFASELINVRGLDAMEYLLFPPAGGGNACSAGSPINVDGSWTALGADGVIDRRAAYAHTLAILVQRSAVALRDAWEPGAGNFLAELSTAGDGSTLYASSRDALNAMTNAIFYVEVEVKDMKVGEASGITLCPTGETCGVESRYAHRSKEHIQANLRAFQRVFLGADPGTEGLGFDDLLRDVGANDLADRMIAAIANAIVAVAAIPGDLETAITSDFASVMAAYEALRAISTPLKTEFVTVLDLDLPMRAPADND